MKKGNSLYKAIPKTDGHVNMFVEDIIQNVDLPLYMPEQWIALESIHHLYEKLSCIILHKKVATIELIIQPDKAMALCINDGFLSLFDSHYHHNKGAAIVYGTTDTIFDFCFYLETFLDKFFNVKILGANFLELYYIQSS